MNIYEKLIEVRKAVPYLQKENSGKQYNYVSSSQVLANVRAKMDELSLLLIPAVTGHDVLTHSREGKDSITYFTEVDMTMTWINAEKPEETITCPWYAQGVDIAGEKGVGKALTYGEKYFLLKSFNIATDEDDPDSFQEKHDDKKESPKSAAKTPPKASPAKQDHPSLVTMQQAKDLKDMAVEVYGDSYAQLFTEATGYAKFGLVPASKYEEVMKIIRSDK